ncbi:MAG TPA: helix-turn-helix transcriptional regulator [Firmicutes bacterium]|nr:helix-turn-helix transcriptional regulator [Bacillota bacterium]
MDLESKKNLDIKIGTVFKKVRKSLGLTQEQVAERLDLASRYISDIERNKVKGSIDTLIGLCNVYNITPTFVLKEYLSNYNEDSMEPSLLGYYKLSEHDKKIISDLIEIMNKNKKM